MGTGNVVEEIFKLSVDTIESIKNMQALAGSYQKVTEEQRKQIVELKILEEKERQLQSARQRSLNPTIQVQLTEKIKANRVEIDNMTKSVVLFAHESEEAKIETNALAQSISNAFKTTAVTAVTNEVKKLNSVYDATKLKYYELIKAQQELSIRGRDNGVVFKGIKSEAEALRAQLDRVGGGVQEFTRGSSSGFNGLQNSINQVTREFPAFAINANTGFLAISNNLPILFDNLSRVRAESEALNATGVKGPSVFKQLSSAVFSFGSLLSVGVTLLTLYGGELAKIIASTFEASSGFELEAKTLEILNNEYDRQIKLQEDLIKARNNTNKEIAKLKLADPQQELLDAADAALDKFGEIEKGYTKAVSKAIISQLQLSEKDVQINAKRVGDVIEIENKKTGTIIRLNREMNQVLGSYSAFYNKNILTLQDVAIQTQLNKLNKARQDTLKELNNSFNSEVDLIEDSEKEKDKIRERFSQRELIRQKDISDQLIQLQIDNIKGEEQRSIEQEIFNNQKAIREIDEANETERKKLAIAHENYQGKKRLLEANKKDEQQFTIDLANLQQERDKEIARIKAENIPKEQQIELRLRLETELQRKLQEIRDKFQKELDDKIIDDVKRTHDARIGILNENNSFELFLLEDKLKEEKAKGDKANKEEIESLKAKIIAKKIIILEEKAQQDIANLKRNEDGKVNAVEQLEIETKLQHDLAKLRNDADEQDDKRRKKNAAKYIDYLSQIIHATIDATNKIISLKLKEIETQSSAQQKRVEDAKRIADRGNAELLELEEKRLDDLNKQREKFVRAQQALAAVELVANTAIAVSKAAAQGGVAAGVTIAAALIALVAGLASARSIASQAAYYEGGLYEGQGYTGDGNPRDESRRVGAKPYIYHKEEFIFNHKKTREFREIFEDVHSGRVDLKDWKEKSSMYDQLVNYKGFTTSAPTQAPVNNVTIIQFKDLEGQMKHVAQSIDALKFGLNIDENGFTEFMAKRFAQKERIKKATKL